MRDIADFHSLDRRTPGLQPQPHMTKTVLFLHRGGDGMRGTEVCLIQSVRAFAALGLRTVVCRNQRAMDDDLGAIELAPELLPIEFPELKLDGKESALPLPAYLRAVRHLHRLVRRINPSLIYCSGGLPCQTAVPVARLCRVPLVCHFHHPAIKRDYYLWLVKGADKIIFPSQYTRKHSFQKARLEGEVIYNGIDVSRFQPPQRRDPSLRQHLGIPPQAIVIGQVAALARNKRPELLIRAFSRLTTWREKPLHLCLVGKGDLEGSLRALVRELGLEARVTITGFVRDVLPYYQHVFDINALVSSEEGLGIAAIEGSACGLPVVVTDCTGLSETVIPGTTGFSFALFDITGLEANLLRLAQDRDLRGKMGAAGRAFAQRTFAADIYNDKLIAATHALMGQ
jgi:glycosyltransferase involved in cell wall biosynthesis